MFLLNGVPLRSFAVEATGLNLWPTSLLQVGPLADDVMISEFVVTDWKSSYFSGAGVLLVPKLEPEIVTDDPCVRVPLTPDTDGLPPADGEGDGLVLELGERDALGDRDELGEAVGDVLAEGEALADGDRLGDTEDEGGSPT